jgi:CHAT domain-containing protein
MTNMRKVEDAATAELMERFYSGVVQERLTPAATIRAAQIEMLRKSHWQSPYYWGSICATGRMAIANG